MDRGGAFQRLDRVEPSNVWTEMKSPSTSLTMPTTTTLIPDGAGGMGVSETVGEGAWVAVSTIGDFVASSVMVAQETKDNVAREARNTTQPYLNLGPAGIFIIG